ncbi:MAG: helix-turn-helix domain-containing protein [Acidobacteria bacterium]|nr:helix-turn-helix domain-containing protein [Acidobacteriota bacterium]
MPWDNRHQWIKTPICLRISPRHHLITELCDRYSISRKTGYKWIDRYLTDGPAGLADRSSSTTFISGRNA